MKNIATLSAEMNKDINVQVNRTLIKREIEQLFWKEQADKYIEQIENHTIYIHDETSIMPYCTSISMYPFLLNWLEKLWWESWAPKHLNSFCWNFVNLVFAVSSQFAWAVATVEFLMYFEHFARIDLWEDYLEDPVKRKIVDNAFQHVVYALNQPAAARWYQSVFWNISLYDQEYFDSMFWTFVFPDWDKPEFSKLEKLQEHFMNWFNNEREIKLLTFPVVTAAMLVDKEWPKDTWFAQMCSNQLAKWNSFFVYQSESADSLASCCRLRNEISDNTFSYSLWAWWVSTWSINVITINMNRLEQQKKYTLSELVQDIHKYQVAYRRLMDKYKEAWMLSVYDAWFISLDKQFLTIWINWMLEAAEFNWVTADNNEEYKQFVSDKLKTIFDLNKEWKEKYKEYKVMFNTEFVPAENLWVKNANWDRKDWLVVPRECYNSYFYKVEDEMKTNAIDKFVLHWEEINKFLDWWSALHLNLEEHLSEAQYMQLLKISAKTWCNYFCTNVKVTICNDCDHIDKRTNVSCSKCWSSNIDYWTRVIWYLKRISSFSKPRQEEAWIRAYHKDEMD